MNQMASPVTEWGAPGAYTRIKELIPHKVPGTIGENRSRRGAAGTTSVYQNLDSILSVKVPSIVR